MADNEEKTEAKGFTVQDRRRFSPETGEPRDIEPESEKHAAAEPDQARDETQREAAHAPLPAIDFSTFVLSLSTQALMHLGEIPDPVTNKVQTDGPVAKQMIDILAMLKDKTQGNLNASEARLMEDILFDLRMKYVQAVKKR